MALPNARNSQPGISGLTIVVMGLVVAALVLAMVAATVFVVTGDDEQTATATPTFEVGDGPATPVPTERIRVAATSSLAPSDGLTYEPTNVLDGDLSTAWNSQTSDDEGRGEVLTFRFTEPVELTGIRFVNGYAKSNDVFTANHRIRNLTVRTDEVEQAVTLMDIAEEQEILFEFGLTSKVEIEVAEIYPGDGFNNPDISTDLALSEVVFVAVQR